VVVQCPAWGPFVFHLLQHPTLTRTYRWNGSAFALLGVTLAPATYQRDAFNRAEVAFRQGDWAAAITRYRVVTEDPALKSEQYEKTNWPALTWLRIGESQALLGDLGDARASLSQAVAAGGTIGGLASAFGAALGQPDGVVRGFAAIQASSVMQQLPSHTAGNLDFDLDAPGLLWLGAALAAYLDAHPNAAGESAATLRSQLQALGLQVSGLVRADLEGDGHAELVALLPAGRPTPAWVMTEQAGRWQALPVGAAPDDWRSIGEAVAAPGGHAELVPLQRAFGRPAITYIGMAHGQLVFADSTAPMPTPHPAAWAAHSASTCNIMEGLSGAPAAR
jgi:hypothetical protein